MTANLKDQKGYLIEVQGFSPAGVQSSQAMANSVVRYLVEKNEVPVYRIFVMGMGNAKVPAADGEAKPAHGSRVEVSLLKNDVDQLASASQPNGEMAAGMSHQSLYQPSASTSSQYAPAQQPSSTNSASTSTSQP
jgi:hypothetical protein